MTASSIDSQEQEDHGNEKQRASEGDLKHIADSSRFSLVEVEQLATPLQKWGV